MASNRAQILITAVDETRRAFQSVQGSLGRLRDQARAVGDVLGRLGGLVGVGLGVRELVATADQYQSLQARLRLAVTSQEEFNRADAELFQIAQRNRAPLAETVTLYARLAPSLQALGRSQSDLLAATDAIGQAVALSGASSEAASGALLQLGQAFASGQLRGEEFNSVIEQTPRLAQAIADGMGVPLGSLRALAKEGQITAQAVLDALLDQRGRLAREYGSLPDTVAGALTRLKNAFLQAFGARESTSALTAGLAGALQAVARHLEGLINLAGVVLVAALGRMAGAFAASVGAARAEAAARLAHLRSLEAEALARARVAQAALAQAQAQGAATAALVANAAKARAQASAATTAVTQAVAATSLLGRTAGVLRGALALLGGPVGVVVTALGLMASGLYSARDAVLDLGGKTASVRQIVVAAWDLVVEKTEGLIQALGRLVGASRVTWQGVRESALSALSAVGTAVRAFVNGTIGAFNAVGSAVGVTTAFLVQRFRSAFSDIAALATALGRDIAAAFTGDFSLGNLRAAFARQMGEFRGFGQELASTVTDAFSRDYVGEVGQAIARRIRPEVAAAQNQVAKAETQLVTLNQRRTEQAVANARETAAAERSLAEELARVRAELLELSGTATSADRRAAIEQEYASLLERLRARGDREGEATVGRLVDLKAAAADLAAYEQQWDAALARMRAAEESVGLQREAGLLTESQARAQILQLHRDTGETLDALLPKLEAAASAVGGEALARVQAWKNEIAQTKLVVDDVALAIDGAVQDSFASMFEAIGSGAKSAKDAFADFARSVLAAINRIASQKLAEALFGSLFGGNAAGGASLGSLVSSLFAGFARGGYVSGPGTATSDSIPARLSAGEYVLQAAAVSRLGVAFLDALNGLSAGPRWAGPRLAFAAGGLVPEAPTPQAQGPAVRIVNVIDPAMAADYLTSAAGERTILNILQRNAGAVRQVLR